MKTKIDARGENDVRLMIGDDTVRIPNDLISAVSALSLLIGTEGSGFDELIEVIFLTGKQAGEDRLRNQLRPLVDSLNTSARDAVNALGDILEQLPKAE